MSSSLLEKTALKPNNKPHYHGHRQRLRARFLETNGQGLADYELLELLLFAAHPRGDVKPLAKKLIGHFGSYSSVIRAEQKDLLALDGIGQTAVACIKSVEIGAQRLLAEEIHAKPVLSNWQALLDYCQAALADKKREEFHILFLDKKNKLIANECQQTGTVDHTPVYVREVVKRALDYAASAIILVHNHPTGDPTPSQADADITDAIIQAAKPLGVTVHDHLIIGKNKHFSFKSNGLI